MKLTIGRRILATIVLLVLDGAWLKGYMGGAYQKMIPKIQKSPMKTRFTTAILAYVLMVIGLQEFVLCRHAEKHEPHRGVLRAFLFGIVLYGVYDFTAASVFEKWDMKLGIVDILWGGLVYTLAYLSTRLI